MSSMSDEKAQLKTGKRILTIITYLGFLFNMIVTSIPNKKNGLSACS